MHTHFILFGIELYMHRRVCSLIMVQKSVKLLFDLDLNFMAQRSAEKKTSPIEISLKSADKFVLKLHQF